MYIRKWQHEDPDSDVKVKLSLSMAEVPCQVLVVTLLLLWNFRAVSSETDDVWLGVILPYEGSYPWVIPKVMPAVEYAIETVAKFGLLPRQRLLIRAADSHCSETEGPLAAIDMYINKTVDVFLGPACNYAVAPVARFSPKWGIPVLTAGALVRAFQDKSEYRLLTRILGAYDKCAHFFFCAFQQFGWQKVGMLFHTIDWTKGNEAMSECYFSLDAVYQYIKETLGITPWGKRFDERNTTTDYKQLLLEASQNARIILLCASADPLREIMIQIHDLNFDNGEYVFFSIDFFNSHKMMEQPWYRANDSDERNAKARKAYESLLTVILRKPTSPEYRTFSNIVKERAEKQYTNFTYDEDQVNSFVGAFHDAVILYSLALNETLEAGESIRDGAAITRRMWNRTFQGILGTVSIDDNGDRNADYSLLNLNPTTDRFEVVANYYGNRKRYEPVAGKEIHWAGDRMGPPPDEPRCGFDNSKCPPDEPFPEYAIVIIVLGTLLLVVVIITVFVYRHVRLEAELAAMNWRVRWDDILLGNPTKNLQLEHKRNSYISLCSGDTINSHLKEVSNRQLFTRTCYYKGAILAMKSVGRQHISITKPLLLEIKKLKDFQNDHLTRFHGICVDPPHQCLLTEYCPKGSLQDVLENDQIKLDWMFRYSIMQDIVRGMAYIHNSEIHTHGNLKSTNCVVDSRFVVKITDFGLHYFREKEEEIVEDSFAHHRNLLWTAPELLRLHNRPPEGSTKGDVYSFAIICQEIVYRHGVFYLHNLDMDPKEIIQKVRSGFRPYFRPTMEDFDCPCDELAVLIRRCWSEDPSERPDFHSLKTLIKRLNKEGDKGDILDNLLSRMEQYANNLEALVEERTADYLEQKRRAEDLLYSMLPKQAAMKLVQGEVVKAETFESVTIYFSDICGFTAMSAESTPMQVVDLLNDLYTAFDSIIENYDVYKVETIGDAYMVVSGLPIRNGFIHAREIARMSLSLLNAVFSFKIRHRPNDQLKLRIGMHTGPVCAGVVGQKMPRYCLFGDTVNTSSRMESSGLPLKIHVSPQTKEVLDSFGTFQTELRGDVEMKGKGVMTTYWLLGEVGGLSVVR